MKKETYILAGILEASAILHIYGIGWGVSDKNRVNLLIGEDKTIDRYIPVMENLHKEIDEMLPSYERQYSPSYLLDEPAIFRITVWEGANMNFFLKWGNWAVGKMMEFLYNTTTITDAGCTMRLIKRDTYERIKKHFSIGTQHFGPELTLIVIKSGIRFIEIPVNYKPRVGKSSVTGSMKKAFVLGLKMIVLITRYRFKKLDFKNDTGISQN